MEDNDAILTPTGPIATITPSSLIFETDLRVTENAEVRQFEDAEYVELD